MPGGGCRGAIIALAVAAAAASEAALWGEATNAQMHKILLDSRGYACDSVLSNRTECPPSRRGIHNHDGVAFARWCDVNSPDVKRCVEPIFAKPADSGLEVQTIITLVARSDPGKAPKRVETVVSSVDLTLRAEYRYDYVLQDVNGMKAGERTFHLFLVDHDPPALVQPSGLPRTQYVPLDRYKYSNWAKGIDKMDPVGEYAPPEVTAVDGYDGACPVAVEHIDPQGIRQQYATQSALRIDLRSMGEHTLVYKAHDKAAFFGLHYRDNARSELASVHVYKGRVVFSWRGTRAPTPRPTPPPTPEWTHPATRAPTPPPTPQGCVYSSWSGWGFCSADHCGLGTQLRTRTIVRQAEPGGAACAAIEGLRNCHGAFGRHWEPCASACKWTWGEWTACNKQCGGGVQMRIAKITHREGYCPGAEQRVCNAEPCATPAPTPHPTPAPTPKSWVVPDGEVPQRKVDYIVLGKKGEASHDDEVADPLLDKESPTLSLQLDKDHFAYKGEMLHRNQLTYYQTYAQRHPLLGNNLMSAQTSSRSTHGWFVAAGVAASLGMIALFVSERH